jgi:hypothetical protein
MREKAKTASVSIAGLTSTSGGMATLVFAYHVHVGAVPEYNAAYDQRSFIYPCTSPSNQGIGLSIVKGNITLTVEAA